MHRPKTGWNTSGQLSHVLVPTKKFYRLVSSEFNLVRRERFQSSAIEANPSSGSTGRSASDLNAAGK